MTTKTYFDEKKTNAQSAARFGLITDKSHDNHVKSVTVPGHDGKSYLVIFSYLKGEIVVDCNCRTAIGIKPCQGSYHGVCYHSMAAVIKAAQETGKKVSFCQSEESANRVAKLGGKVILVTSRRNARKHLWVVVK